MHLMAGSYKIKGWVEKQVGLWELFDIISNKKNSSKSIILLPESVSII